jgi:hypothetical protein
MPTAAVEGGPTAAPSAAKIGLIGGAALLGLVVVGVAVNKIV